MYTKFVQLTNWVRIKMKYMDLKRILDARSTDSLTLSENLSIKLPSQ